MNRLEKLFESLKHLIVTYDLYSGCVCGFTDERFLIAIQTKLPEEKDCSFKILPKGAFVLPEYKEKKFRYVWSSEAEILAQNHQGRVTIYENLIR